MIEKNKATCVIKDINKEMKKIHKIINGTILRKKMQRSQLSLVDGRGKERIMKAILNL